jgi:hypothetical protein
LLLAIIYDVLNCEGLTDHDAEIAYLSIKKYTIIKLAFVGTVSNIFKVVFTIFNEAKSINETPLLYLMTRMTANNKWFPFIHEFQTKEMDRNISFSDMMIHLPVLTDAMGMVSWIEF